MAVVGARARMRPVRAQRSGSIGRTLAAASALCEIGFSSVLIHRSHQVSKGGAETDCNGRLNCADTLRSPGTTNETGGLRSLARVEMLMLRERALLPTYRLTDIISRSVCSFKFCRRWEAVGELVGRRAHRSGCLAYRGCSGRGRKYTVASCLRKIYKIPNPGRHTFPMYVSRRYFSLSMADE